MDELDISLDESMVRSYHWWSHFINLVDIDLTLSWHRVEFMIGCLILYWYSEMLLKIWNYRIIPKITSLTWILIWLSIIVFSSLLATFIFGVLVQVVGDESDGVFRSLFGQLCEGLQNDGYDSLIQVLTDWYGFQIFGFLTYHKTYLLWHRLVDP